MIGPMDPPEQAQWLATHIPHRVRAAIARLPMENSILRVTATIDPQLPYRTGPHLLALRHGFDMGGASGRDAVAD